MKKIFYTMLLLCLTASVTPVYAQEAETETQASAAQKTEAAVQTSSDLVRLSWEASSQRDPERLEKLVGTCLELYGAKALEQQASLSAFPPRGEEKNYQDLNDVATCLFVKAEYAMNSGQTEDAVKQFQHIMKTYSWAQTWDPRGWFWSVAEKSHDSIKVLTGEAEDEIEAQRKPTKRTIPQLHTIGTSKIVDYTKYGKFENVGTDDYRYRIIDAEGLSKALGEGIYPNTGDVYNNPRYKIVKAEGRLEGSHWDHVITDDLEAAYFKWATAREPWGVRLFYMGIVFEKAGMIYEALRAYHALVVHFPKTVAWTYWQTPWYPGQAAIAKIKHILRSHPELNLKAKWMSIKVDKGFDNDVKNDEIKPYPGRIVSKSFMDRMIDMLKIKKKVPLGKIKKRVGKGDVRLVQYENNHWQLLVDDKPYIIRGITYAPTKIGQSPDKGNLANWSEEDTNNNGRPDGPYDSWVDKNRNNKQDPDEPVVGDLKLMTDMGVNTIRIYHDPENPNKEFLRKMYEEYGIRVIMGDFLGKYAIGSGATWAEGTDYDNPEHRQNMMKSVEKMVKEFKDEPYILMWLIGNENNYGVASNADKKPESYFKFVNKVAKKIKRMDKNHPVSASNGDTLFLDIFAKYCPDVDIYTANVYRGDYGFVPFWEQVADASGKPAYITEFGAPSYAAHLSTAEAEEEQMKYHWGNWMDIRQNYAGNPEGEGNSLGGVIFEWLDEWWKNYEPYRHDRKSDAVGPFPGGYYFEEWFGIVGQGNGKNSPFLRQLKESYHMYKDIWNE